MAARQNHWQENFFIAVNVIWYGDVVQMQSERFVAITVLLCEKCNGPFESELCLGTSRTAL